MDRSVLQHLFIWAVVHLLRRWLLAPEVPEAAEVFWTRCDGKKGPSLVAIFMAL